MALFYNYCKYFQNTCVYLCNNQTCSSKKCPKGHRRSCRFGNKCKRRESCEFIHKEKDSNSDISCLKAQAESLKNTVAEINAKIKSLQQELINHKTPAAENNVEASEEFKCSYVC